MGTAGSLPQFLEARKRATGPGGVRNANGEDTGLGGPLASQFAGMHRDDMKAFGIGPPQGVAGGPGGGHQQGLVERGVPGAKAPDNPTGESASPGLMQLRSLFF